LLNDLQSFLVTGLTIKDVLINMATAFICGVIISSIYRLVYRGPSYLPTFANSLVTLVIIMSIVITVIGNNLARAFGLVGAMSIIRFRTALRDTQDIVFVFYSLAIGMAAGVGLRHVAVIGTIATGIVIMFLSGIGFSTRRKELLLQFSTLASDVIPPPYLEVINKYCKKASLINIKSNGGGQMLECFYHLILKEPDKNAEFIGELRKVEGMNNINLFFDKDE
jgi:uncharacterized membrane protein YhiD involved in acid resistance